MPDPKHPNDPERAYTPSPARAGETPEQTRQRHEREAQGRGETPRHGESSEDARQRHERGTDGSRTHDPAFDRDPQRTPDRSGDPSFARTLASSGSSCASRLDALAAKLDANMSPAVIEQIRIGLERESKWLRSFGRDDWAPVPNPRV